MITVCPVCGRSVVAHWPEFWPYRRGEAFYCSQNCYDISLTRDLNMLHDAARRRRGLKMARMKKDGTPAKRPGPKTKKIEIPEGNMTVVATKAPPQVPTVKLDGALRIETPETGKVEVVEKPERSSFKAIINPLEVYSVKSRVVKANYRYDDGNLILEGPAFSFNMLLMTGKEWLQFADEIKTAIDQLGVKL